MQLAATLGQILHSGKMIISINDREELDIVVKNKKIEIDAKNKEFINQVFSSLQKSHDDTGVIKTIRKGPKAIREAISLRKTFQNVSNQLKDSGITITLSYRGDKIVTAGALAASKFSRVVTGTKSFEINSLSKLVKLGISSKESSQK